MAQTPSLGSLCFLEEVTGAWGGGGVVSRDRAGRGQRGWQLGKAADAGAYTERFLPVPRPLDVPVMMPAVGVISLPAHGGLSVGTSDAVHGTCVNACAMISVLQRKKQRLREIQWFAQDPKAQGSSFISLEESKGHCCEPRLPRANPGFGHLTYDLKPCQTHWVALPQYHHPLH